MNRMIVVKTVSANVATDRVRQLLEDAGLSHGISRVFSTPNLPNSGQRATGILVRSGFSTEEVGGVLASLHNDDKCEVIVGRFSVSVIWNS
jgi:hypothetical protein